MEEEKVILIAFGCVMGFVVACATFGVPDYGAESVNTDGSETMMHTEGQTTQDTDGMDAMLESSGEVDVFVNETGMFVDIDGTMEVVSGRLQDGVVPGPGFHVAVPSFEVSPNGEYVYYCEQQVFDEELCHDYVYLIGEHSVRPLKYKGHSLTSSVANSEFKWRVDNLIESEQYISESNIEPWVLTARNQL